MSMLKNFLTLLAFSAFLLSNVYAHDILEIVSKGELTSNSIGVKELSFEEKKQIKGGYKISYVTLQSLSFGGVQVKEMAAIAVPDLYGEISTKGLCSLGKTSCYSSANTHYSFNSKRYRELESQADPLKGEFLAFTLKRIKSYINPYKPTLQYTTGAAVLGITKSGSLYKMRNASTNNAIIREMRTTVEKQMKNMIGL